MTISTATSLLVLGFFLLVAQLLGVLAGAGVAIAVGGGLALLAALAFRQFDVVVEPSLAVAFPAIASALAVAFVFFGQGGQPGYVWLAPALAGAVSGTLVILDRLRSRRCALCSRRLGNALAFSCPRCELTVCADACWVFDRSRCRLCEENKVPIFTPDGRWWDRQFGPRTRHGRCQLCLTPESEGDLRACRQCGRPQCRDCWDAASGVCPRCGWIVEDLPDTLRPYLVPTRGQPRRAREPRSAP
jgi:hypothetical protein